MICPICKLELKDSMIVLNLTANGIKEFHLKHAHFDNLVADLLEFVEAISWLHKELQQNIPYGNSAVLLNKRAREIKNAVKEKWEGEFI